jgi:hypothetical protein
MDTKTERREDDGGHRDGPGSAMAVEEIPQHPCVERLGSVSAFRAST